MERTTKNIFSLEREAMEEALDKEREAKEKGKKKKDPAADPLVPG